MPGLRLLRAFKSPPFLDTLELSFSSCSPFCFISSLLQGIYGLIIAVILVQSIKPDSYSSFSGFAHLAAGLACGLSGLGAGIAIGIVGDAGVRANGIQPKLFVPMVLILIFAEALGLYGLIVGIILSQAGSGASCTSPKL